MARPRSKRVEHVKQHLIRQLQEGVYRIAERFPSARAIAADFHVSYQTAHKLLDELSDEGFVVRRSASGTYVAGELASEADGCLSEVQLILSARARRASSFGARLLSGLAEQLRRKGISWQIDWAESIDDVSKLLAPNCLPVLWEAPNALEWCCRMKRRALLLNTRPSPGIESALVDSVSLDDYFGGCCAADILVKAASPNAHLVVMTGPDDPRSDDRRDGFLSHARGALVVRAGGWYMEDGMLVAPAALATDPEGIFCVNDRLAQSVLTTARRLQLSRPRIIGFDNAPVAAELNLTTIAIPWNELVLDAAQIIHRRLSGDSSAARRQLVTPQVILRDL
jgi:DNA-binding transcriptional regulator YhcF (GntR family)